MCTFSKAAIVVGVIATVALQFIGANGSVTESQISGESFDSLYDDNEDYKHSRKLSGYWGSWKYWGGGSGSGSGSGSDSSGGRFGGDSSSGGRRGGGSDSSGGRRSGSGSDSSGGQRGGDSSSGGGKFVGGSSSSGGRRGGDSSSGGRRGGDSSSSGGKFIRGSSSSGGRRGSGSDSSGGRRGGSDSSGGRRGSDSSNGQRGSGSNSSSGGRRGSGSDSRGKGGRKGSGSDSSSGRGGRDSSSGGKKGSNSDSSGPIKGSYSDSDDKDNKDERYAIRLNCGGNGDDYDYENYRFWDKDGNLWFHDYKYQEYKGDTYHLDIEIYGTDDDNLYKSDRYIRDYDLVYKFDHINNGRYFIKLHFAEVYYSHLGQRVFDIYVNDEVVEYELDIYGRAGFDTALILEYYNIGVYDNSLTIKFARYIENPKVNAIEVYQVD